MHTRSLLPLLPYHLPNACTIYYEGILGLLHSTFFWFCFTFFSQTVSAPHTLFEKKGEVVGAPKEVLHKLQFSMKLLYVGVCGAVPDTPSCKSKLH
jgi:hypothetical protein